MRRIITTILIALWTLGAGAQDSLYLASESPAIKDPATAAVTVAQEITLAKDGKLTAIKFWKNENGNTTYQVVLWNTMGVSLINVPYKSSTTGWQNIAFDFKLAAGAYIIGVYYPNGKYSYSNSIMPRTGIKLAAGAGLFANGNTFPSFKLPTTGFFVTPVITYPSTVPLSVHTSPDRDETMPKDTVGVSATATGYSSFKWTVEDSQGKFTLRDTNTLRPYVQPLDSAGCRVWLMCTVTAANGDQLADVVAVRVAPHPKYVVGYILLDGRIVWRTPPTFIELPTDTR